MHGKGIGLAAGLLLVAVISDQGVARTVIEYDYLAYSGAMSAGTTGIRVIREGDSYEIRGEAEATGLFKLFSGWHSEFRVVGHVSSSGLVMTDYEHTEANRSRTKAVRVVDGLTHYVRNGEAREPVEAAAPIDVFSLIFIHGRCDEAFRAHSGRMGFDIVLASRELQGDAETCVYSVVDDEGTAFRASVSLEDRGGVRAPVELDFAGYALGVFRLQDVRTYEE